jgi:hypothetical protein
MHPNATEFAAFVYQAHKQGNPVTRSMAIKWIISSYKREALIRFGAKKRATHAHRAQQLAGDRPMKRESMTDSAIAFSSNQSSITEKEAEAFLDTGISEVMNRLVQSRAGTYVYDRQEKVFLPNGVSKHTVKSRSFGVVRKILTTLSISDLTAAEIAERCCIDVSSVRNNLNHLRRAGSVEAASKNRCGGKGKSQIVWRIKQAACNLTT